MTTATVSVTKTKGGVSTTASITVSVASLPAPVVAPANFSVPTNPSGTIGSLSTTNSPTSFQIVSGDPNGYFAVGQHHTAVPGSPIPPDGVYNLEVAAANATGMGPAAQITVTVGKAITLMPTTFTPQLPVVAGQVIGTCAHSGGTPTSWAIIAGDPNKFFAIDKNGVLSFTAAGAAGVQAIQYSLTIQATNAFGSVS